MKIKDDFAVAPGCLVLACGIASAQVTTATFYGTLTDSTGAAIPGATVTLVHEGTGATRHQNQRCERRIRLRLPPRGLLHAAD